MNLIHIKQFIIYYLFLLLKYQLCILYGISGIRTNLHAILSYETLILVTHEIRYMK